MTVNKRRKFSRMRGTHTHGWGAKKKHRGAGHRGGRGMAGSGKRADQKKPTILKLYGNDYYGKKGFHRPQKLLTKIKAVNIGDIAIAIPRYLQEKKVKKEGEYYLVNTEEIGFNKVLGGGEIKIKIKIKAPFITAKAKEKIEASGGTLLTQDVLDK